VNDEAMVAFFGLKTWGCSGCFSFFFSVLLAHFFFCVFPFLCICLLGVGPRDLPMRRYLPGIGFVFVCGMSVPLLFFSPVATIPLLSITLSIALFFGHILSIIT